MASRRTTKNAGLRRRPAGRRDQSSSPQPRVASLAGVLLPEYRRRVLGLLLLRPDETLHGREVARRTGVSPGTVTRELNLLADVGLLTRERRGNQQLYGANQRSAVFEELAGILRKTSGLADVLADALAPARDRIRVAFVFGSMATGRAGATSDVDVMIIGALDFGTAVDLLAPTEKVLGREVNPRVFSEEEFRKRAPDDAFLQDVLTKPRVFVAGDENELAELGRQNAGVRQAGPQDSRTASRRRTAQSR
jgi:predicted nucleotidyltransferase/predicted transcriptional regulator